MTYIQKEVGHLNIKIKENNSNGKVSFYLTSLNKTYLAIFFQFPNDTRQRIYLTFKHSNSNFSEVLYALENQNTLIEIPNSVNVYE